MASIVSRKNSYSVIYTIIGIDGKKKQKWESFKTLPEAKKRKAEIEYCADLDRVVVPNCTTIDELLEEYVNYYGKERWSPSYFMQIKGYIQHYISPLIGKTKLVEITARFLERYYTQLLSTPAIHGKFHGPNIKKNHPFVTPYTIRKIHNLLRSALNQAVKWELVVKNPCTYANVPKHENQTRNIWDAETLFRAIDLCEHERLKLCMNLAFACSLRLGEILGLTWDCVDISEDSLAFDKASIHIKKELQRVNKEALANLSHNDIITIFPETMQNTKSKLVLKKPKTASSVRKVFLPRSVAYMLVRWKEDQDLNKKLLGSEYNDFGLVVAGPFGMPTEGKRIQEALHQLITANDLPQVCFHSIRHTSITYKLKLTGGDIKAVQGDSGHAQAKMVTDQYSHILDEGRVENAKMIENAFYSKRHDSTESDNTKPQKNEDLDTESTTEIDPALLSRILSNPETIKLLLAKLAAAM